MSPAALIALVLASADAGTALAPLGLNVRAQPEKVKLGEPFAYEIVVQHRKAQRPEVTLPPDLGPFDVLEIQRRRKDGKDDRAATTFTLKMAVFDLGPQTIPELTLEMAGDEGSAKLPVQGVTVEGLPTIPADAENAELYDIQPPVDVPVRSWRLLWALLAAAALAGATYLLVRWLRRARPVVAPVEPPRPLDVRTRAALDQLLREDLPGQGRMKEFHFRLSEIVRGYLGERYQFEALECTSSELLGALRRLPTPTLPTEELGRFVQESDLVKFARLETTADRCKQALDFAYLLLDRTWPPPAPPQAHAPGPVAP